MKTLSLTTLSLIALFSAGSAFAADDKPMPPKDGAAHEKSGGRMFKETDGNTDGAISKDEWRAKGDKMFGEIDANGDGKLTPDETKAHHSKKREEWKERREERKEKVEEHKEKLKEKLEKLEKKTPEAPAEKH